MESKVLHHNIGSTLLCLLSVSILLLLLTLHPSNPFTITSMKKTLNHGPPLPHLNMTDPIPHPPPTAGEKECDLFAGRWVWEPGVPAAYTNVTCPTLPDARNCGKYGKGQGHLQWRWKPAGGCELPRFEPRTFLSIVRGKKMALVGDSLARNHAESLLCLLSQAEAPINTYKDADDKFWTWHFPSHNFTLMIMWTEFLVARTPRIVNGKASGFDVHLDRIDRDWADKLPELHYIIISGGNWFFRKNYVYEGGELIGCVSCKGDGNVTDLGVGFAVRRVFRTAFEFIGACKECEGLVTLLRTYTPSHFEHGYWFDGGYCNRTQPWSGTELGLGEITWELRKIQVEEMERVKRGGERRYGVLDVTKAMVMRADGHPGSHWTWGRSGNDCLHWCLPGAIDMWSDQLLAVLEKGPLV